MHYELIAPEPIAEPERTILPILFVLIGGMLIITGFDQVGIFIIVSTIFFGARKAFTAYYRPNVSAPQTSGTIALLPDRIHTPEGIFHLEKIHRIRCHTDGIQGQRIPVLGTRQPRYSGHAKITLFHGSKISSYRFLVDSPKRMCYLENLIPIWRAAGPTVVYSSNSSMDRGE